MEYGVVSATDSQVLVDKVQESIDKGWIPQGGLAINGKYIVQAMVRISNG